MQIPTFGQLADNPLGALLGAAGALMQPGGYLGGRLRIGDPSTPVPNAPKGYYGFGYGDVWQPPEHTGTVKGPRPW